MSTVVLDPAAGCAELLARIHSVALEEAVAIEEENYDAIWLLRRQREELTHKVAEACARLAAAGGADPAATRRMMASMARIEACDRNNRSHLERSQQRLADELAHLGAGRRAMGGYRVPDGPAPTYVDRRG